jgi:hypothetical protein
MASGVIRTAGVGRCLNGLTKKGQMRRAQASWAAKLTTKDQMKTSWYLWPGNCVLRRTYASPHVTRRFTISRSWKRMAMIVLLLDDH